MTLYHLVAMRVDNDEKWFSRFAVVARTPIEAIEKFTKTDVVGHPDVWVKAAGADVFHIEPTFMDLTPAGIEGHYDYRFPLTNTYVESWLNDHYYHHDMKARP